jgi:transcriptional regulator with XRE-family HTH domain
MADDLDRLWVDPKLVLAARKRAKLSPAEAAKRLGWALIDYLAIERGNRLPTHLDLAQICAVLDVASDRITSPRNDRRVTS